MKQIIYLLFLVIANGTVLLAQVSSVWVSDNGDGTYKNPILFADYSDPDVIRVGEDYYLASSSFNCSPSLPILHSKDLVNWQILTYALNKQIPVNHFEKPQHGNGVWAPSLRYQKGEFYLYYPDPDFGIYLLKAKNPAGPWSEPILVKAGKGLIDPCPLWDEDGKVYLVHAFAGSRAGIKSILIINQLNSDGTQVVDNGVLVFDGHDKHPTLEGPKLYKQNGYYYISAPAGGVATGWQLILRSKNIYGPYEEKIVLDQGTTSINGPHQGAWVDTPQGEWWFIHFQDKGAYGRVVHLQPMNWVNNWPLIGIDKDGDGKGEPVLSYKKPNVGKKHLITTPIDSDEFNENKLGLQWQWHANPQITWAFPARNLGFLRMFSVQLPPDFKNYWDIPNLLLQKFPAEQFEATIKLDFKPRLEGEKFGFMVMGGDYAYLGLVKKSDGIYLTHNICQKAAQGTQENETIISKIHQTTLFLRISVDKGAICRFSYSLDNKNYQSVNQSFTAVAGKWIGAKLGFFMSRDIITNDSGFADIDYFRVKPLSNPQKN
jgi:beta-xylosidase